MEKIVCDDCHKDIGDSEETCPYCGSVTYYKNEKNRSTKFREHAKKSLYPGRNYEPAKKVSLWKKLLWKFRRR